jgi:hypothetical protein
VSAAPTNLTTTEFPTDENIVPEIVIEMEPEDGAFEERRLDKMARENVRSDEVENCCLSVETDNARSTPKPAALLQVMKESDLQNEPLKLETTIRALEEGLPNPKPDIATIISPVVGIIASDTRLLNGFK